MTTIEISTGLNFTTGEVVYAATLYTDRKHKSGGGLTKGKKKGSIVDDTLPDLLRNMTDLIEQHQERFNEDPFEIFGTLLEGAKNEK